jgi:hypothetical protein
MNAPQHCKKFDGVKSGTVELGAASISGRNVAFSQEIGDGAELLAVRRCGCLFSERIVVHDCG